MMLYLRIFAFKTEHAMKKLKKEILEAYKGQPIARTMYVATWIFAIAMLTAGFLSIPLGEIHHSVLIGTGMILVFTLISMAILNDTNISISGDLDDKELSVSIGEKKEEKEEA